MVGYDQKSVESTYDQAESVTFTIEVDITGTSHWVRYETVAVEPEATASHRFPNYMCFMPRNAIIAATNDGDEAALVICFQCSNIRTNVNGERLSRSEDVSPSGKGSFDRVFTAAGLSIAD